MIPESALAPGSLLRSGSKFPRRAEPGPLRSMKSDGDRLRDRRCQWRDRLEHPRGGGLEFAQNRLPGAFDRALQVYGLHAKHGQVAAPREQPGRPRAAGAMKVLLEDPAEPDVFGARNFFDRYEISMQHILGFGAQDIGESAGHTGSEVQAQGSQDQNHAPGHIFAAMLADTLYNSQSA